VASFSLTTGQVESWNPIVGLATIVSPIVFELAIHQDTIMASEALNSWHNLVALPLADGSAGFTDDDAPNHLHRFYLVTVP
jgi:hypothetical protein